MQIFKLRAECFADVSALLLKLGSLGGFRIASLDDVHPDCEFEFGTELDFSGVRDVIREIEDGHVMLQTVQPIAQYTGERKYGLE